MFEKNPILTKYNHMTVQAKAATWFILCSFLQKGISFITVPIFTRLLTAEEYGTYSLYISWLQILTIISTFNLSYGVFDNAMSKFEEDRDRYISSMQGLTITLTTIVFIIFLSAMGFWEKALSLTSPFIFLMFIEMFLRSGLSFWSGRQRFEYRYKKLVAITLSSSIINPILGIAFVYWRIFKDNALGRIFSSIIIDVIICGTIIIYQFVKGKTFFHRAYWKYGLALAIPMIPHYLSGTILNQGDRIMIERMVDKSSVAYYSVAYSVGMLVQIFTHALHSATTPWFYSKYKARKTEGIAKTVNGLLLFVAGICICLMTISPELIRILGSSGYTQGAYVIPPVAASVYFIFLYYMFSLPEFYFEKTKFMFFASLSAAVVNLILNYIFISLFGFVAAGYTTLACYVMYSVGHYLVSNKIVKENFGDQRLYDMKTILGISIILIIYAAAVNMLFDFSIIRYGILAVGLVVAFIKREYIIKLLIKRKAE